MFILGPNLSAKNFMVYIDNITSFPDRMLGKPVIKGTRIAVAFILKKLAEGASPTELLEAYPNLTDDAIMAALIYCIRTSSHIGKITSAFGIKNDTLQTQSLNY